MTNAIIINNAEELATHFQELFGVTVEQSCELAWEARCGGTPAFGTDWAGFLSDHSDLWGDLYESIGGGYTRRARRALPDEWARWVCEAKRVGATDARIRVFGKGSYIVEGCYPDPD